MGPDDRVSLPLTSSIWPMMSSFRLRTAMLIHGRIGLHAPARLIGRCVTSRIVSSYLPARDRKSYYATSSRLEVKRESLGHN